MKTKFWMLFIWFNLTLEFVYAQRVVIDRDHLASVNQNAVARSAAESTHEQYLTSINNHISDLNINMSSVVMAHGMVFDALSNVNSALKNGLAIRNMSLIIADMYRYIDQALILAKDQPYLLLFAGNISAQMRAKATALITDVSTFILKEDGKILSDFNARDQLIRHVTHQLQMLNGLAYGAWKSIYWAKQKGMFRALLPFAGYINQDRLFVQRIIQQAKYLK